MTDGTIDKFVSSLLAAKKQAIAERTSVGGENAIYPEIAREVLAEYPAITVAGKATVLGTFKHDSESYRPHQMGASLREAARILET